MGDQKNRHFYFSGHNDNICPLTLITKIRGMKSPQSFYFSNQIIWTLTTYIVFKKKFLKRLYWIYSVCYRMRKPWTEWSAIGQSVWRGWYSDSDGLPLRLGYK